MYGGVSRPPAVVKSSLVRPTREVHKNNVMKYYEDQRHSNYKRCYESLKI